MELLLLEVVLGGLGQLDNLVDAAVLHKKSQFITYVI